MWVFFLFQFPCCQFQMFVDICLFRNHLDLQLYWADFKVRNETVNDALLLLRASQKKVNRINLQDLDIPVVCRIDDTACDFLDGQILFQEQSLSFFANRVPFAGEELPRRTPVSF